MFSKVLVSNRGEIAVRVLRALRELGVVSVALYSEADRDALHVRHADEAFLLGPAAPADSYLNIDRILEVAERAGVDAIHPGYGFLAENADFARAATKAGFAFVGPSAEAIERMGDKVAARQAAVEAGAPVVPGTLEPVTGPEEVREFAAEHGFPIAIKASFGGGGRGFKVVRSDKELEDALASAQRESAMAFGRDEVYLERYLEGARHIEAQIVADTHGNVVFLGERDCTLQRRHQKLVEESPSPVVSEDVRRRLGESSVAIARRVGYVNAGTIETLLDSDLEHFYFMEMNTRLQVEHPVTELCTGIDLVRLQIKIAAGEELPFSQEDIVARGHAIECRINAEDPAKKFFPSPGRIGAYVEPSGPGVRVDSGFGADSEIPRSYDSLIAKLVVYAEDRDAARARMARALDEFTIEGVKTTIPFHRMIMEEPRFAAGDISTSFVENELDLSGLAAKPAGKAGEPVPVAEQAFTIEVDGKRFEVAVRGLAGLGASSAQAARPAAPVAETKAGTGGPHVKETVRAPMQGTVVKTAVSVGDAVKAGDLLIVLEAMKMENHITAPRDGTVGELNVSPGENVETGAPLAVIE
ncbi:MAG TPA: acetyl-CoA carboxylase biotin carboxylase subunit [Actinomycetota bacterium]|nr:acetyl-CoA carboxylase biotin carboxylase subunit [Actinomycetota bacterium]